LYFSFFVSVSAFFHVFLTKIKKNKNSCLLIGGQKGVLPPILIIGGVPRLPPESTPMILDVSFQVATFWEPSCAVTFQFRDIILSY